MTTELRKAATVICETRDRGGRIGTRLLDQLRGALEASKDDRQMTIDATQRSFVAELAELMRAGSTEPGPLMATAGFLRRAVDEASELARLPSEPATVALDWPTVKRRLETRSPTAVPEGEREDQAELDKNATDLCGLLADAMLIKRATLPEGWLPALRELVSCAVARADRHGESLCEALGLPAGSRTFGECCDVVTVWASERGRASGAAAAAQQNGAGTGVDAVQRLLTAFLPHADLKTPEGAILNAAVALLGAPSRAP